MIFDFCNDVASFLKQDPNNVVAVHCKGGKGRTGLMISAYLVISGVCETQTEALKYFAKKRSIDDECSQGVTQPSQIRFLDYFYKVIKNSCIYIILILIIILISSSYYSTP